MEVRSDRRYQFEVGPDELWPALTRFEHYRRWWPWLRRLDAVAFSPGERWSCVVQPPLPYSLRFDLVLDEVVVGQSASAAVEGDIVGHARLDIEPTDGGSELHLVSALAPSNATLRAIARFARPVVQLGHDWVLDTGLRQFKSGALRTERDTR